MSVSVFWEEPSISADRPSAVEASPAGGSLEHGARRGGRCPFPLSPSSLGTSPLHLPCSAPRDVEGATSPYAGAQRVGSRPGASGPLGLWNPGRQLGTPKSSSVSAEPWQLPPRPSALDTAGKNTEDTSRSEFQTVNFF